MIVSYFFKNKAPLILLFFIAFLTSIFLGIGITSSKAIKISIENGNYEKKDYLNEPQAIVSDPNKNGGDLSLDNEQKPENNFLSETGNLEANIKAAMSIRINSGEDNVLFKKNESKKLPIASLTKLMTALVVLENYDLGQEIIISENAIMEEGGKNNFRNGETFSVKNLLYAILIESSNKAAYAVGEKIGIENFIDLMNLRAADIGMISTYFSDNTGLGSDSYSTAEDIIKISRYLFNNHPLFREIISLKEYNLYLSNGSFHHKVVNTNKMLGEMNIIGGKTGWTTEARGCFMAIQKNPSDSSYFIYVVLGAEDRFAETRKLINESTEYSGEI